MVIKYSAFSVSSRMAPLRPKSLPVLANQQVQCAMETPLYLPTDHIINVLVSFALMYGSDTWNLTTHDCNRLNTLDMNGMRRLENIKWTWYHHVRNGTIRKQTKKRPASSIDCAGSVICSVCHSQCLAQLIPARLGISRSVHVQLGVHVIRVYIICLSPQSHTSV